ncbi:MAG: transposase [Candidatus Micrarchaeota archaeon]|nr:transposase [Candidatus Micrarchaeota archaeon]
MDTTHMDGRQRRGLEIAQMRGIERSKGGWLVPSQTVKAKKYFVDEDFVCDCPDSAFHKATCKHAYALRYYLSAEWDTAKGTKVEKVRISYKQAWHAYTQAQNEEVNMFDKLLADLVGSVEEPPQEVGRPRLSLRESVFCAIQKVYSQLSSRRAYSLFRNASERGQIRKAPNYNAINKLLNEEELTPILHRLVAISALPLRSVETDFAVDSSGFRTTNFSEYAEDKYGLNRQKKWVKAHICTGVKTNVITAVEVTGENGADSPQFAPLVKTTADRGFTIQEVSADKAYSSRQNLLAVQDVGGRAFIPFKTNATGNSRGSYLWMKMYHYFSLNQHEFMEHYHKRSNVETTFYMIKMKFGDKLKSKNPKAQENELLCKIIAHNIVVLIHEIYELGVEVKFEGVITLLHNKLQKT